MGRKTVGLDMDGVVYDFVGAACEWSGFDREKATSWDIFYAWGNPGMWNAFDKHAQSPNFCLGLKLITGARRFVSELREIADVLVVTSPYRDSPTWAYERELAVLRDFEIEREWLMSTRSKQYARVDLLIDDKPANVDAFPGKSILFDQPWNREHRTTLNQLRCYSYDDVLKVVRNL